MKKLTQDIAVLNWLKENVSIDPIQALSELGCYRLSARIHQLRKKGYQISTKRITKRGRLGLMNFAEYSLDE